MSGADNQAKSSDARREARFPARSKMILLMPKGGGAGGFESRRVKLVDCSARGLGLEDERPMEPGQEFAVYLRMEQVTMVMYAACPCQQLADGRYKIGARLVGFLDRNVRETADKVLASLIEEKLV